MCKQRLLYFILIFFGLHFSEKISIHALYYDLKGQSAIVCGRNNNSQMMYNEVRKKGYSLGLVLGIQTNKGQELMILGFYGLITWHSFAPLSIQGLFIFGEKLDFGLKNIPQ